MLNITDVISVTDLTCTNQKHFWHSVEENSIVKQLQINNTRKMGTGWLVQEIHSRSQIGKITPHKEAHKPAWSIICPSPLCLRGGNRSLVIETVIAQRSIANICYYKQIEYLSFCFFLSFMTQSMGSCVHLMGRISVFQCFQSSYVLHICCTKIHPSDLIVPTRIMFDQWTRHKQTVIFKTKLPSPQKTNIYVHLEWNKGL